MGKIGISLGTDISLKGTKYNICFMNFCKGKMIRLYDKKFPKPKDDIFHTKAA